MREVGERANFIDNTGSNSHLMGLYKLARMGFSIVPIHIKDSDDEVCLLYMDGNGIRVQKIDGKLKKSISWGEFDNLLE